MEVQDGHASRSDRNARPDDAANTAQRQHAKAFFATIGVVDNDNGEAERGLDHDGTVGWMSEAHRQSLGANRSGGGAICTASIRVMQKRD